MTLSSKVKKRELVQTICLAFLNTTSYIKILSCKLSMPIFFPQNSWGRHFCFSQPPNLQLPYLVTRDFHLIHIHHDNPPPTSKACGNKWTKASATSTVAAKVKLQYSTTAPSLKATVGWIWMDLRYYPKGVFREEMFRLFRLFFWGVSWGS